MPTVITDKTDFESIEKILEQFDNDAEVNIYASKLSTVEQAIVMGNLQISELIVQIENDKLIFILNNGTIIERQVSQMPGLSTASQAQIKNYENMGDGILWKEVPQADLSLKYLIKEELLRKYNLKVA